MIEDHRRDHCQFSPPRTHALRDALFVLAERTVQSLIVLVGKLWMCSTQATREGGSASDAISA
jgi:hypothetical protein